MRVARLLSASYAQLRQALDLDGMEVKEVPTAREQIAALEEEKQQLEAKALALQSERDLAVDRARQSAKRAKLAAKPHGLQLHQVRLHRDFVLGDQADFQHTHRPTKNGLLVRT